ncbi:hypothetical protein ACQKL6_09140 [Peribacillus sp. NPDC097197]|uniref:hypothetical protein n=1 Tax=Peribacillus sp. NPDC097197 TaxID=3390615 RepID=UPI003D07EB70
MNKDLTHDELQFLKLIKPVKRQLFMQHVMREGQLLLLAVSAWTTLLFFMARIVVIPFVFRYFFIGIICLLAFFVYRIIKGKPGNKTAALLFNQYVPDDRVVTGFAFLGEIGELKSLQLRDAIHHMKIHQEEALRRKKVWVHPKWLTLALCLAIGGSLLAILPNQKMDQARQAEKEVKLVEEVKKELDEKVKEIKDPDVKKTLKDVKEKVALEKEAEKALEALAKQSSELQLKEKKQREKQESLETWKDQSKKTGLTELSKALEQKDMRLVEKELKELNERWDELSKEQKQALESYTEQELPLTEEQLDALMQQLEEAMESGELAKQLASANQAVRQAGSQLQNKMSQDGIPSSQTAFSNSDGTQGNQPANQPLGQPSSTPNGQPNANSGNNPGSQKGQGQGQGQGQGASGTGGGKGGTKGGAGQGSREMLTIPEKTDGKQNMETDNGKLGEGSGEQEEAEGPVLRGNLRNYEEVYQQYEESYRKSTDRLRLPSDLNDIVKNYFNNLDPER